MFCFYDKYQAFSLNKCDQIQGHHTNYSISQWIKVIDNYLNTAHASFLFRFTHKLFGSQYPLLGLVDSLPKQSCYVWHKLLNLYPINDMTLSERATPAGHQHTVFTFTPTNKQIKAMIYKLGYNYKNILGIFRILYNNGIWLWISYINLYFALIGNWLKPASARFLFGCGLCVTQNHAESQQKPSPNILQTPARSALCCRFD